MLLEYKLIQLRGLKFYKLIFFSIVIQFVNMNNKDFVNPLIPQCQKLSKQ